MCSRFTDADVGKRVETAAGESIGVVTMTGDETAYVELEGSVTDSIKAALDWNADTDNIVPIGGAVVREVTADVVRLEGKNARTTDADTDPVFDRDESTGHEGEERDRRAAGEQGDEIDDDETDETAAAGEGRSGEAMEPETDEMTESGAERHPESEDRPPEGDRTVTKDRGEKEDR
ncbi:hypothetical protein [Natronorubrum texcoconense]|uniref:Uncharacterized protein n=1 Tax=Natronorubrum texcoconense TaxID=1095776 RepID=A0A1G8X5T9_9EURY|nr:hypothetical protein [Natronorubrum texcoconense]SDJ85831.1 hypothetical protein SAMN04515672_1626 [Natronorubrum texcoconense]